MKSINKFFISSSFILVFTFLSLGILLGKSLFANPKVTQYNKDPLKGMVIVEFPTKKYRLKLLTATQFKLKQNLSAKDWVEKFNLIAAINAGMYQEDHKTSVGYLIAEGHKNNGHLGRDNAILAFDPKESGIPSIQIIDRTCQSFKDLKPKYNSFLQGIRMITCDQKNTWEKGGKKWPTAALAINKNKNVLFIFSIEPRTPHDFINLVLNLPHPVHNMMYLEGGPPAQVYLKTKIQEIDLSGQRSSAVAKTGKPMRLPIPNVIGVIARN